MARLPVVGDDNNTWGNILNDFLAQEHNTDGTQKPIAPTKLTPGSNGDVLTTSSGVPTWTAPGGGGSPSGAAGGSLAGTYPNPSIAVGAISSTEIADATIINADISGSAAIAKSKLANLDIVNADVNAAAAIAESKLNLATDAAAGTGSRRTLGNGATQAAAGNDSRLSDSRTPTDASVTDAKIATTLSPSKITGTAAVLSDLTGKVDKSTVTTKGDLLAATASATPARLGVGSDTQVLTADSTQTTGLKWAPAPGGSPSGTAGGDLTGTYPNPTLAVDRIPKNLLTTKGDVIAASASATPARVGVGSDGQVLTADSSQTAGVKWAAGGGNGDIVVCAAPTGIAATDNANFQAGLTAAAGGTLLLRHGTYNLTTAMTVSSFTTIIGDMATIVHCTVSGAMFNLASILDVTFRGMRFNLLGTSSTLFLLDGAFGITFDGIIAQGTHTQASPQPNEIGIDLINNSGDCWFIGGSELLNFGIGVRTASYALYMTDSKVSQCQYSVYIVASYASGIIITNSTFASTTGGTTISHVYAPGAAGRIQITGSDFEGATNTIAIGNGTLFQGTTTLTIVNSSLAGTTKILDIQSSYSTTLVGLMFTADVGGATPTTLTINPVGAPDNGYAMGLGTNVAADSDTIAASLFPPAWTYFGRTESQFPGLNALNNTWSPADYGYIAWAYDPGTASTQSIMSTAGQINLVKLKLRRSQSITNVILHCTNTATLTSGQCFAALYQGGTLIGVTASQSTAWQSVGTKVMPLAGGPFTVAAGDIQVAFFANGSTLPTFARTAFSGVGNQGLSLANSRFGNDTTNTGRTTSMPSTLGTVSAISEMWWAAVS